MTYQQQWRIRLVGGVVASVFGLCTILALSAAAYLALLRVTTPSLAALFTALGGLACILLTLLIVRLMLAQRRSDSPAREREQSLDSLEQTLQAQADPMIGAWARRYPGSAAGVALAIGVAAGYSPVVRRFLQDLYEQREHDRASKGADDAR